MSRKYLMYIYLSEAGQNGQNVEESVRINRMLVKCLLTKLISYMLSTDNSKKFRNKNAFPWKANKQKVKVN